MCSSSSFLPAPDESTRFFVLDSYLGLVASVSDDMVTIDRVGKESHETARAFELSKVSQENRLATTLSKFNSDCAKYRSVRHAGSLAVVDDHGVVVAIQSVDQSLDGGLLQVTDVRRRLPRLLAEPAFLFHETKRKKREMRTFQHTTTKKQTPRAPKENAEMSAS